MMDEGEQLKKSFVAWVRLVAVCGGAALIGAQYGGIVGWGVLLLVVGAAG